MLHVPELLMPAIVGTKGHESSCIGWKSKTTIKVVCEKETYFLSILRPSRDSELNSSSEVRKKIQNHINTDINTSNNTN